jgi:hypothetical protein
MKDADGKALAVGDIVQIKPDSKHRLFQLCVGVVSEVKSFGGIVDFFIPSQGIAPLRCSSEEFVIVGRVRYPHEL